ncbi:putative ABC transporter, ATP-binding protein [Treponema primitia ZAS-2]|uniref:Putative ABC transporter, ATP-binding protein n=1 Tax=Treponema primitia (strain ATCC BAA-887 / DSM 12427 / ZAS-2) TaxID=545694 RepID=F5YPS9_TREPZ|nr:putative ABC transporter, ATP-binding protein [Treponema primitia ZAS-2]
MGRGEKILILGPSGSGKSTLAHCINGLIPHAFKGTIGGSYTIMGEDGQGLDIFALSKKVGTLLQDTDGQFVGLSAGEDIAFAAENDCVSVEEMHRRVPEAARLVHIEDHLAKPPQDLSGGQKQRVSLAGLLMNDVELLLFDEPLANLDPATGKEAIELIDRLHRETGKTVIIVEHRLEDVLHRPVDRIIVIEKGRIMADLPPAELLASDLLGKAGIREPFYVGALRYAGVELKPDMGLESVETLRFDPRILKDWDAGLKEDAPDKPAPVLLEVRGLQYRYPDVADPSPGAKQVLDGVSFSLAKGECISMVGRNGAGKSTLAKLIAGFIRPDAGQIFFDGKDLAAYSIKERSEHIGYVMQNPNQMISFPLIFDETALALRNRGINENETRDRVFEALGVCGLYQFRNWPVNALSFGQKKRLTIASVLVMGPSLIILDEPTAGQDYRHYSEIMEFLRKLNREQGLSFLLITHDMHLMLEYTRRALVLSEGKLLTRDGPGGGDTPAAVLTDDFLVEAASLKRTSLYDLAIKAGMTDPRAFVRRFIDHEQSRREAQLDAGLRASAQGATP